MRQRTYFEILAAFTGVQTHLHHLKQGDLSVSSRLFAWFAMQTTTNALMITSSPSLGRIVEPSGYVRVQNTPEALGPDSNHGQVIQELCQINFNIHTLAPTKLHVHEQMVDRSASQQIINVRLEPEFTLQRLNYTPALS